MLLISTLVLVGHAAHAEITDEKKSFQSICIEEKSTGFSWRQGNWAYSKFEPSKYLAVKIDLSNLSEDEVALDNIACIDVVKSKLRVVGNQGYAPACYNVRLVGDKMRTFENEKCWEEWAVNGDKKSLKQISCKLFRFMPDGAFHAAHIHDSLSPPQKDYKDSLSVSEGQCSVLQ
jgi:hypothetical protein